MINCPGCGARYADGANFCGECGSGLATPTAQEEALFEETAAEPADAYANSAEPAAIETYPEEPNFENAPADAPVAAAPPPPPLPRPAPPPAQMAQAAQTIPRKIESNLTKAIISTVCCCTPIGIVAIVFAAQVESKLKKNDYEGALEASKKADLWSNLSIALCALCYILMAVFYIAIIADAVNNGTLAETFLNLYGSE